MIHPLAYICPGATIHPEADIGPFAYIGPDVVIGKGTKVHHHGTVEGHTTLGEACEVFPQACVGSKTQDLKWQPGITTYVKIGDRTVIRECATIHSGTLEGSQTVIGADCLIMAYCHVAHGCSLGHHVIMSNSVQVAGECLIEDHVVIGGTAALLQFSHVGTFAMVGGGTQLRKDAPPYMLTMGVENLTVRGLNSVAIRRRPEFFSPEAFSALKDAYQFLYSEGMNRAQALERIARELPQCREIVHLLAFYQNASKHGVV
ncbi:MAG: acyl-ACP--UDP-N-acetylglucosamine O-acyltransferase [Kiritimatiellia bacterium]